MLLKVASHPNPVYKAGLDNTTMLPNSSSASLPVLYIIWEGLISRLNRALLQHLAHYQSDISLHCHKSDSCACPRVACPFQTSTIGFSICSCLLVQPLDLVRGLQGDERAWDLHTLVIVIGSTARVVAAVPEAVASDETLDVIQRVLEQVRCPSL